MKKRIILAAAIVTVTMLSCKKEECHECHYERNGEEVELGERCDDELTDLEASGIMVNDTIYDVHCHEH